MGNHWTPLRKGRRHDRRQAGFPKSGAGGQKSSKAVTGYARPFRAANMRAICAIRLESDRIRDPGSLACYSP
jgi:hypothetical protein